MTLAALLLAATLGQLPVDASVNRTEPTITPIIESVPPSPTETPTQTVRELVEVNIEEYQKKLSEQQRTAEQARASIDRLTGALIAAQQVLERLKVEDSLK